VGRGAGLRCLWWCPGLGDGLMGGLALGGEVAVGLGLDDNVKVGVGDGVGNGPDDGVKVGLNDGLELTLLLGEALTLLLGEALTLLLGEALTLELAEALALDEVCEEQSGTVMSSSSRVTAALRARAAPKMVSPVWTVIEVRARMLPWKVVPVPIVAELPTCQKTLQAEASPVRTIVVPDAVVSADGIWKMKEASGLSPPSSVSVPPTSRELGTV
jgi:hypothetical protein